MSRICTIALAVILLVNVAQAIEEPEDLGYGVLGAFTAPYVGADVQNYLDGVQPGEPVQVYFTLYHHRLPSTNLGGFECLWEMLPGTIGYQVLELEFGVWEAYNFGDEHNLMVGVRLPTPYTGLPIHLFTVTIMFTEQPDGTSIRLQPSPLESIPGEMAYADYVQPEILLVMRPNNVGQSLEDPVFWFNPTVAVEARSLSSVKALFD